MLNVNNVTFAYSRKNIPVINGVSLEVKPGSIYGLLGKNGVGKSTLLYLMAGLLVPHKGYVKMNEVNTCLRTPSILSDIFIMPEEVYLPAMSMKDYVRINAPFYPRFSQEEMESNLDKFDINRDMNLGELSMGQKKKVFISFALACNTSLLLMDEPTNGLDIPGKETFRSLIAGSMNEERTIIISTHQVHDVDRLLDHVIIMNESKVVFTRGIDEIISRLKFTLTDSQEVIKKAFYTKPTLGGTAVIIPNEDGMDTEMDIEMFFDLATGNPGLLEYAFKD